MSRDDKYIIVGRIFLGIAMVFAFGFSLVVYNIAKDNETKTPVEEMYHKQLIVTLDSILDARFGADCCEEDIDTINANTFNSRFGGNLSPID